MTDTPATGPRKPVTVTDIAQAAGVSRATVSLVLRGSPLVHADTRARVEAELKRQRYVYNRGAANLRRRTSSSVALVIDDLSDPFLAEFAMGVEEALRDAGYVLLLGTGDSPQRQQAALSALLEHGPAGVVLMPAQHGDGATLQRLLGPCTAVVAFDRPLPSVDCDVLGLDNERGARLATEHLLSLGHQRIVFFGGHADSNCCRERRQGYSTAMSAAGFRLDAQWLIDCAPSRVDAARETATLLSRVPEATAAVCFDDDVALGLQLGLIARGIKPGADFALTGFHDIAEAALTTPPLTTVAVDPRARGRQSVELLLQRVNVPDAPARHVIAPVRLVVRGSSGAPGPVA